MDSNELNRVQRFA